MVANELLLVLMVAAVLVNSASAQSVVCPAVRTTSGWLDLFPLPCKRSVDCSVMGVTHLCCKGFCTKGVRAAAPAAAGTVNQQSSSSLGQSSTTSTTSTTSTSTTTTTRAPSTTSPTTTTARTSLDDALRPFLQLLPIPSTTAAAAAPKTTKAGAKTTNGKSQKLVCPKPGQAPVILFPIPCQKSSQCRASSGPDQVCCEGRCVRGVVPPRPARPALTHQPLLGVIPRECPSAPLGELLFEVQSCKADVECWPRVCCPDGERSYCRTARARLDLVPVASQIDGPVRMLEQYLQCTPPPQYDLFPQRCSSSVDCFPNLCCAEGGKKHCRPPQRSLLALLSGVTQRVGSTIGNLRQNNQVNKNKI